MAETAARLFAEFADLPALIKECKEVGLTLQACPLCRGKPAPTKLVDDTYHHAPPVTCPMCRGTGEDWTPGGVYLAVIQSFCLRGWELGVFYGGHNLYHDYDKPRGMADHSWGHYIYCMHNRTPEAIASSALGLWLAAQIIPPVIDDAGMVRPEALAGSWKSCPQCHTALRQIRSSNE